MSITPLIFVDHGSPSRILEDDEMNQKLEDLGKDLINKTKSVLIISAHFVKNANYIVGGNKHKTIYDFYGFPEELYNIKYEPQIDKELNDEVSKILGDVIVSNDWGLDHGAWSVLKRLFPKESVKVTSLSVNSTLTPKQYYEIGKKLSILREKGVLIIGSGSIVHNLRDIDYNKDSVFNWAFDFDNYVKDKIEKGEYEKLVNYHKIKDYERAVYTFEHYVPLLYILGATKDSEKATYLNHKITNGSLSNNLIIIK